MKTDKTKKADILDVLYQPACSRAYRDGERDTYVTIYEAVALWADEHKDIMSEENFLDLWSYVEKYMESCK